MGNIRDLNTTKNPTFDDVTVSGDLTVNGTTTTINSTTFEADTMSVTVADTQNKVGLTVTQNDTTNNPVAATIVNAGTGAGLYIDQNGNGKGLLIDSAAATEANYALDVNASNGARAGRFYPGDFNNGAVYLGQPANGTNGGTFRVYRNLAAASTAVPLAQLVQDNTGDDQSVLVIQNDGTGNSIVVNTDDFVVSSAGDVGIGVASPLSNLHVKSADSTTFILSECTSADSNAGATYANDAHQWAVAVRGSDSNDSYVIRDVTNAANRFYIDTSGNVGIGTLPQFNFDLKTATDRHVVILDNAAATTITGANDAGASSALRVTGSPLIFSGNGGGGVEHARIDSTGKLGVGITPVSPFHLYENTTTTALTTGLTIEQGGTGDSVLHFKIPGQTCAMGIDNSDGDSFKISMGDNMSTASLKIDTSGQLSTSQSFSVEGKFNIGAINELTISSGAVTITKSLHYIDTEGDAASDDLDTINGGTEGDILILRAANNSRTVVVKNATGNILCAGDFSLDNTADSITLLRGSGSWVEISRSDNGA